MRDSLTAPCPRKSCLVIDQSSHIRKFVCANLGIRGFEVNAAATLDEGARILARWTPRLIILELPFNAAWELSDPVIPVLAAMARIPLIIFTTENYLLETLQAANPNVAAVLVKPVPAGALISTVMQVLHDYSAANFEA